MDYEATEQATSSITHSSLNFNVAAMAFGVDIGLDTSEGQDGVAIWRSMWCASGGVRGGINESACRQEFDAEGQGVDGHWCQRRRLGHGA